MECISLEDKDEIDKLVRQGKYLMAAQALKNALSPDQLERFMHDRFADPNASHGAIHERLFELRPPLILTTNYDLLLDNTYASVFKESPHTMTFKQAPMVERFLKSHDQWVHRPIIFKIHGSAAAPDQAVFSEKDYRDLRYREHGYRAVLSAIFLTKVVLMLGFSASDPEIMLLTESLRESLDNRTLPDYIVLPKGEKGAVEKKRLRDDFGLHVIEYDTADNHRALLELVDHLVTFVPEHARLTASAPGTLS